MNDMSMNAVQAAPDARAIVVFGRDNSSKPHASCFDEATAEQAEKAAGLMGMHVLRLETAEARGLATKLPQGRVFASGRAFVPFVKAGLYASLAAIANIDPAQGPRDPEPAPAASAGPMKANTTMPPCRPGQPAPGRIALAIGSVVLAPEAPMEGWWEAVVVKLRGDLITLRWRDYPDYPLFSLRRDHIVHLPPGAELR